MELCKLYKKLDSVQAFLNETFPDLKIYASLSRNNIFAIRCFIDIAGSFYIGNDETASAELITERIKRALEEIKQLVEHSLNHIKELEEKDANGNSNGEESQ